MRDKMALAKAIAVYVDHVDSCDYADYCQWRWGTAGEDIADAPVGEPHEYPMPEWLKRQTHFENQLTVIGVMVKDLFLRLVVCKVLGHEVELIEGGPDNPYVDTWCVRCDKSWQRTWF